VWDSIDDVLEAEEYIVRGGGLEGGAFTDKGQRVIPDDWHYCSSHTEATASTLAQQASATACKVPTNCPPNTRERALSTYLALHVASHLGTLPICHHYTLEFIVSKPETSDH
jgi:hypothetical protein